MVLRLIFVLGCVVGCWGAEGVKARRDPVDQLFRRAPMAESSRSIVVGLGNNLHLAFDTELCRTHTVWEGPGLNLWGPPYHGGKTPFICDFEGRTIFSFPPLHPWGRGEGSELPVNFREISTVEGRVRFGYDVYVARDKAIRVEEEPFAGKVDGIAVIGRKLKLPAWERPIRFLAAAEFGGEAELKGRGVAVRNGDGKLFLAARSDGGISWEVVEEQVDYEVERITEEGTEKGNPVEKRKGLESRVYVTIAPSTKSRTVSVLMVDVAEETISAGLEKAIMGVEAAEVEKKAAAVFSGSGTAPKKSGDEFYEIEHFPVPAEIELLITGMDWLSNGDLAVCTWLGEIYIVENATGPVEGARYRRFARGLNEPLGLTVHEGEMYVVQKGELTRVSDTDGDGVADRFECVNDDWGYSGNYHSYSFGPVIDEEGNFTVFTAGQRGRWDYLYQGWAFEVSRDGEEVRPIASGLRAPNGFGTYQGDLFYVDNQGNWVGACKLSQVKEGSFHGFPSSRPAMKGIKGGEVQAPAVWFPRSLAPSSSGMETISDGRFGPFEGQLLVGDFQNAVVTRVFLEKVKGEWQGAVFPFARRFQSGVNRLRMGADGAVYVGGLKRTWAAAAPEEASLERIRWTGKTPFEVKEVRALRNGYELEFTNKVDPVEAGDPENYALSQFTYEYHEDYGSHEFDHEGKVGATPIEITRAELKDDGKTVRLEVKGQKEGFVTWFRLPLIISAEGEELREDTFWYTLNRVPGE